MFDDFDDIQAEDFYGDWREPGEDTGEGLDDFVGDEPEDGFTDAEADADTLASAGYGMDEDYSWNCEMDFYGEPPEDYDGDY
jgi:hypothetical protein